MNKHTPELIEAAKEAVLALAPFVFGGPDGHARNKRIERYLNLKAAIAKAEGKQGR